VQGAREARDGEAGPEGKEEGRLPSRSISARRTGNRPIVPRPKNAAPGNNPRSDKKEEKILERELNKTKGGMGRKKEERET